MRINPPFPLPTPAVPRTWQTLAPLIPASGKRKDTVLHSAAPWRNPIPAAADHPCPRRHPMQSGRTRETFLTKTRVHRRGGGPSSKEKNTTHVHGPPRSLAQPRTTGACTIPAVHITTDTASSQFPGVPRTRTSQLLCIGRRENLLSEEEKEGEQTGEETRETHLSLTYLWRLRSGRISVYIYKEKLATQAFW